MNGFIFDVAIGVLLAWVILWALRPVNTEDNQ